MNAPLAPLAFTPGARIVLPRGAYRYREPLERGHLLTSLDSGATLVVSDEEMESLYVKGEIREDGAKPRNRFDEFSGLAPGETLNDNERARAWWLTAWDDDPCPISHKKMAAFIAATTEAARRANIAFIPASGTLMTWVRERGEWRRRPSKVMRTQTGKAPRASKWDPFVEYAIRSCVAWFYSHEGYSVSDAHARLTRMLRLVNFIAAKRDPSHVPYALPTYETIRVRVQRAEDAKTYQAKFGGRRRQQRMGGTAPITAPHVMHTVMIDSTTADAWNAFREETCVPLGRPTTYLAVDVRARMSLSHIWLGAPGLEGVMAIVKRVLVEWGKPVQFIIDNTLEHRSPSFEEAMRSAGIHIVWAPVYRPEYKDVVEVTFTALNKAVFHKQMGGAVPFPPTMMRRLDLDPGKTAAVSLESLREQVDYFLANLYPIRIHGGIGEKPGLVWSREIAQRRRRVVGDLQSLLAHFGKTEVRPLSREGVTLKDGLRFYDREAVSRLLSDNARTTPIRQRRKGSATVTVKVVLDPSDISRLMVWNERRRRPEYLENVHVRFGKECASHWEYLQVKAWADEENADFSTDQERLAALWRLRTLISSAAPAQLHKARKRHLGLLKTRPETPVGDYMVEEVDREYAHDGNPDNHKKTFDAPATTPGAPESADGIPTTLAASIAESDPIPHKGVRRGGPKAVEKQKATVARKRAAREAAEAAKGGTAADKGVAGPFVSARAAFADIGDDEIEVDWVKGASGRSNDGKGKK